MRATAASVGTDERGCRHDGREDHRPRDPRPRRCTARSGTRLCTGGAGPGRWPPSAARHPRRRIRQAAASRSSTRSRRTRGEGSRRDRRHGVEYRPAPRTRSPPDSTTATRPSAGCTTRRQCSVSTPPRRRRWPERRRRVDGRDRLTGGRDRGDPPVCFQFLGIPELDHRLETAEHARIRGHPDLEPNEHDQELAGVSISVTDPGRGFAGPRRPRSRTDLRGLPPAYITTMEFDPLHNEGIMYTLRLDGSRRLRSSCIQ